MSIALVSLEVRQERRIRLLFSNTLSAGAYGAPAPAGYSIESLDEATTAPTIGAALFVPGSSTVVELALNGPIIRGALYRIKAEGIPAVDVTTTPLGSELTLRWGFSTKKVNVEPALRDRQRLLYFIDLLWSGTDYQETATGDLDQVDGTANVTKALNRGVETNPGDLTWDVSYGAGAREFVDSPSELAGTLKGSVSAQILRDPRVKSMRSSYEIQDEKTFIYADPVLVSGETLERVTIEVPNYT